MAIRGRVPSIIAMLLIAVTLVSAAQAPASAAPLSARSYYVTVGYNLSWAYDRGCTAGSADLNEPGTQERWVILDFGSMTQRADGGWDVSGFGVKMPLWKARDMVGEWARGYYNCTGTDTASVAYVGLGVNNSAGDINFAAGAALAGAAKAAIANLQSSGSVYNQGRPAGANDFEDWGQGTWLNTASRNWINGYNSVSGRPIFVNYGAAGGCPQYSVPSPSSCNAGLNAETIWQVSWSGVAYPLPEIYATSGANARQWRWLSKYSIVQKGSSRFWFEGVMAQSGACSQRGGCPGADNSPTTAWNQLETELDNDSALNVTPGSPTNIWWS